MCYCASLNWNSCQTEEKQIIIDVLYLGKNSSFKLINISLLIDNFHNTILYV